MTRDTTRMLQASSVSEAGPPMLVSIALDLQIIICTLLHPSDILALRQTCKTLQLATRQRAVWVAALHRVCLENSLFLPSFPILDMSDAEIEHAAMGPRRWIELCAAFEKQYPNDFGPTLRSRTIRFIEDSFRFQWIHQPELYIVPGGRYMVSYSPDGIFVWDLGYTSSADCKLIASVGPDPEGGGFYSCMVQATPDGMGLIIFSFRYDEHYSIYEIYPQSEIPQLTRIAHLGSNPPQGFRAFLLPDRVLLYRSNRDSIVFILWDYRMNYSMSFSADIDFPQVECYFKVIATKIAIFVPCIEGVLVWAIPPLSPQPLDFFHHTPAQIPPLFRIAYPDDIVPRHAGFIASQTMSQWYFGSSQPLYFHILCGDGRLHRFEIIVKPDLFDTSLRIINTEVVSQDFDHIKFRRYRICDDTLVACEESDIGQFRVYTWSRFSTIIPAAKVLLPSTTVGYNFFLCPTSGRCVHLDYDSCQVFVVDLF